MAKKLRITREVTLSVAMPEGVLSMGPGRDLGLSQMVVGLWFTFEGEPNHDTGMVVNVHDISYALRQVLGQQVVRCRNGLDILLWARGVMSDKFSNCKLLQLGLEIHEALSIAMMAEEPEMIQVTTKYELAASHRLWNSKWDKDKNFEVFGKCSNPAGHGHNYLLEITLCGRADRETGLLTEMEGVDKVVEENIIEKFDHKNLNEDVAEFGQLIPTVENMAIVFWDKLLGKFGDVKLSRIKVWETPKTAAEYSGN